MWTWTYGYFIARKYFSAFSLLESYLKWNFWLNVQFSIHFTRKLFSIVQEKVVDITCMFMEGTPCFLSLHKFCQTHKIVIKSHFSLCFLSSCICSVFLTYQISSYLLQLSCIEYILGWKNLKILIRHCTC